MLLATLSALILGKGVWNSTWHYSTNGVPLGLTSGRERSNARNMPPANLPDSIMPGIAHVFVGSAIGVSAISPSSC